MQKHLQKIKQFIRNKTYSLVNLEKETISEYLKQDMTFQRN